ncbi:hypothetical protein [Caproiciproducens faecalis]|uniref:Uncharacterized protein n=1 Tax=Caproiciproducens faecalis TaxID=2820301 RepID=A0ABS7DPA4_9FIRM|nr:hypothetical protein [Caproiciproducens faecalis]MBW7573150.1 hypothetical protein [Caproiciproducens faecalis]
MNNSEMSKIKMGYGLFFLDEFEKFNKCYLDYIFSDYSSNFVEPNNRFKRSGPLPDWAYYERPIQNSDEAREILDIN